MEIKFVHFKSCTDKFIKESPNLEFIVLVAYPIQLTRGVVHWSSGSVNHSLGIDNTS